MSNDAYLGLDLGGTGAKAVVYDAAGNLLGQGAAPFSPIHTQDGRAETRIEEILAAARVAVRQAVSQGGASVRAMSISSQGETFVALDDEGRPLHPVIMWYDARATEEAAEMAAALAAVPGDVRPEVSAIHTGPKIMWLHRRAKLPPARRYLLLPDYLAYHLTGRAAIDTNTASSTGFYRDDAPGYCLEALAAAGVTESQLSEILAPGAPIGTIRADRAADWGLSPDTLLITGTNDQYAGALAAGNIRPGLVSETTGTCLGIVALTEHLPDPLPPGVFGGRFPIQDYQFALVFAKTAGLVLDWFVRECGAGDTLSQVIARAAKSPIGSHGLTVLPHFDGAISPRPYPAARGHFCNLTLGHTRGDMYRAILESIAFSLRENLEALRGMGLEIASLRALGGGAKSDLWLQIKADVTGCVVERPAVTEAGALGAAMLAMVGVGAFTSLAEASAAVVRIASVFTPHPPAVAQYQEPFTQYLRLSERLYSG